MPRYLFLQGTTAPAIAVDSDAQRPRPEPEPRTYYVNPEEPDVLIEKTRDGDDFIRICSRHQWAGTPTVGFAPPCPFCLCEFDERRGRRRYAELHSERVRIVIYGTDVSIRGL